MCGSRSYRQACADVHSCGSRNVNASTTTSYGGHTGGAGLAVVGADTVSLLNCSLRHNSVQVRWAWVEERLCRCKIDINAIDAHATSTTVVWSRIFCRRRRPVRGGDQRTNHRIDVVLQQLMQWRNSLRRYVAIWACASISIPPHKPTAHLSGVIFSAAGSARGAAFFAWKVLYTLLRNSSFYNNTVMGGNAARGHLAGEGQASPF